MKPEVIGLGNCASDFLAIVPSYPALDERMKISQLSRQGGGEVATALVALSKLGISTSFIGKIGDDETGRSIQKEFKKEGVDTSYLIVEKNKKSLLAFCVVDKKSGKRTIFWHKETSTIKPEELDKNFITSAKILHLDEYEPKAALVAAKWAKKANLKVVLDIDRFDSHLKKLVEISDVLIGSQDFAHHFHPKDNFKAAEKIFLSGPKIVVITLGEKGCICKSKDKSFIQQAFKIKVVDTTGAGDAFHGAFIYGMLKKWDLEKIAKFSNAVASINCTRLGGRSGLPNLREVNKFLNKKKGKVK